MNKGQSWFPLQSNLPTVPVYDLKIHPRDHELIAATHGRGIQIVDVAPLQQMTPAVLSAQTHLFAPTVAFEYGQMIAGTEPRAQRMWRGEGGPSGAEIRYKLSAPAPTAPRVLIVNAAGDTIARLTGTNVVGLNRVSWNLQASTRRGGRRRWRRWWRWWRWRWRAWWKSGTSQRCGLPSRIQSATGRGERAARYDGQSDCSGAHARELAAVGVEDVAVAVAVVAVAASVAGTVRLWRRETIASCSTSVARNRRRFCVWFASGRAMFPCLCRIRIRRTTKRGHPEERSDEGSLCTRGCFEQPWRESDPSSLRSSG